MNQQPTEKTFTIADLKNLLAEYPDEMPVKILVNHERETQPQSFDEENILITSETAYVDSEADPLEWDCEDGKIELGRGIKYLLINPMIV
jgi:hypothetical protein